MKRNDILSVFKKKYEIKLTYFIISFYELIEYYFRYLYTLPLTATALLYCNNIFLYTDKEKKRKTKYLIVYLKLIFYFFYFIIFIILIIYILFYLFLTF